MLLQCEAMNIFKGDNDYHYNLIEWLWWFKVF